MFLTDYANPDGRATRFYQIKARDYKVNVSIKPRKARRVGWITIKIRSANLPRSTRGTRGHGPTIVLCTSMYFDAPRYFPRVSLSTIHRYCSYCSPTHRESCIMNVELRKFQWQQRALVTPMLPFDQNDTAPWRNH